MWYNEVSKDSDVVISSRISRLEERNYKWVW